MPKTDIPGDGTTPGYDADDTDMGMALQRAYERGRKAERKKVIEVIDRARLRKVCEHAEQERVMTEAGLVGIKVGKRDLRKLDRLDAKLDAYNDVLDILKTRDEETGNAEGS